MSEAERAERALLRLLGIMRRLRDPAGGCPWDREQDFASIAPYTIEEAYEVADAIGRDNPQEIEAELGDLLFQVVFHAQMGDERGWFNFASVADSISDKLTARHPHVFADAKIASVSEQNRAWEEHKARERAARPNQAVSELADVPLALPALARAAKLGKRAGRVGFDWPDAGGVREKIEEELREVAQASSQQRPEEIGDLLFAVGELVATPGCGSRGVAQACQCQVRRAVSPHGVAGPRTFARTCRPRRGCLGCLVERGQETGKTGKFNVQ